MLTYAGSWQSAAAKIVVSRVAMPPSCRIQEWQTRRSGGSGLVGPGGQVASSAAVWSKKVGRGLGGWLPPRSMRTAWGRIGDHLDADADWKNRGTGTPSPLVKLHPWDFYNFQPIRVRYTDMAGGGLPGPDERAAGRRLPEKTGAEKHIQKTLSRTLNA